MLDYLGANLGFMEGAEKLLKVDGLHSFQGGRVVADTRAFSRSQIVEHHVYDRLGIAGIVVDACECENAGGNKCHPRFCLETEVSLWVSIA